jgi:hypothetical protein
MSPWDISIIMLHPTKVGGFFNVNTIENGSAFDVILTVQIGENLNEMLDRFETWVYVRNLSQSTTVLSDELASALSPANNTLSTSDFRVSFNDGWKANEGEVLQAIAVCKASAGHNTSYAVAESGLLIVAA